MSQPRTHLELGPRLRLPITEVELSFVRASGPGGQRVNKTSTQVELRFDVAHSPSLSEADRAWLMQTLRTKLDARGVLHVTAQEHRSQLRNREAAMDRLEQLLRAALVRPKRRKPTRPSRASREERLSAKKHQSEKKRTRTRME